MAKEAYYFSHDYDPTGDPKISAMIGENGGLGYGVFWRLIEMLHSDKEHRLPFKKYLFVAIAKQMLTDAKTIEAFITSCINDYELFATDGENFWSERVDRNIGKKDVIKQKRQEAGRLGGINKASAINDVASAKQILANAKQMPDVAKQNVPNKTKVNETIEIINSNELILEVEILQSPFEVAFNDFVDMRKKIKKVMTPRAMKMAKDEVWALAKGNEEIAIAILNKSTQNSWAGVFPLKKDTSNEGKQKGIHAAIDMLNDPNV